MGRGGKLILAAILEAVANLERHAPVSQRLRLDPDHNRLSALGDAIFDRILDDRLEEKGRKARLLKVFGNIDLDMKPVGETRLLDVEIEPLKVDLFGKGYIGAWVERKARPEECRERQEHAFCAVAAAGHH